jgi:hypothetical protein
MMKEKNQTSTSVLEPLTDEISQFIAELQLPVPDEIQINAQMPKKKATEPKSFDTPPDSKWHFVATNRTRNCQNCLLFSAKNNACGVLSCSCINNPARPRFLSRTAKTKI